MVVSATLTELGWANSSLLTGDVLDGVAKLKDQEGGPILITGSTMLARTLLRAGLVDELSLLVHPIVVGGGAQRLFEDDGPRLPLDLAHATTLSTGVVHAVYRVADTPAGA